MGRFDDSFLLWETASGLTVIKLSRRSFLLIFQNCPIRTVYLLDMTF
jgi:hypothetical protein